MTDPIEPRRCIGSGRFGIEAHQAPTADFPVQPSQRDGLGRMCKTHWRAYTGALRKASLARMAADAVVPARFAAAPARAAAWPDIDPLSGGAPLPAFPLHTLPAWMAGMVAAAAANTGTDPCLAAVTALGLASTPLANRFSVTTAAWTERGVNLFVVSVADPGELKSAVFGALDAPLRRHEREMLAAGAPARRDGALRRAETEARLRLARDELKRALKAQVAARTAIGEPPDGPSGRLRTSADPYAAAERAVAGARAHLRSIEAELDAGERGRPAPYALLADDSTPEALQRQMARQDGRVGIVSAESELFHMAAGRYANKAPNLQVYLAGFSGDPLRGERISRDAPAVEHPGLAVVIATQPVVLEEARRNMYLLRRGLLARFLYAVPASRAGTRQLADRPAIPGAVEREYRDTVLRLCRLGDAQRSVAPVSLRVLGEAGRRLERWHDESLEPRRDREAGDLAASEAMAAWAGRLHGLVVRIAGVLHLATHLEAAATLAIGPETMSAAIAIGEWAIEHAFAAFGVDRLDGAGQDALRVLRWDRARPGRPATFSLRDACRGLRGLDADRVRAALRRLEQHGYVRIERPRSGPPGGRPSDVVAINPAELTDR